MDETTVQEELDRGDAALDVVLANRPLVRKILAHVVFANFEKDAFSHLSESMLLEEAVRRELESVDYVMLCQSL